MATTYTKVITFLAHIALVASLVMLCAITVIGEHQHKKKYRDADLQAKENLLSLQVAPEKITTKLLDKPVPLHTFKSELRLSYPLEYWVMMEAQDWVILNGRFGGETCPAVLQDFVTANTPMPAWSPGELEVLTKAFRDKPLDIIVHIPRFSAAPTGLAGCPGLSFDASTGRITLSGKPLAVLSKNH